MFHIGLKMKSILLIFTLLLSSAAVAEQKMILLEGEHSKLMQGDRYKFAINKPQGYKNNEVLPALLSIGWRIQSVHINEKSTGKNMYGYLILERNE